MRMCGHKVHCHSQGNYNYSTQTGTPTYSYKSNGIHEVGRHKADFLFMDITTDNNIEIHCLSSQAPKGFYVTHAQGLTALRRTSHFFTPSQNKLTSFLAAGPERTKQATNYTGVSLSSLPQDLPTTISVNSKPLFTDFRCAKKGKLWKPS